MPVPIVITAHTAIVKQTVFRNGSKEYENKSGDADGFLMALYKSAAVNYPKFYKMDHLSKLGLLAAEFLLKDSGINARYPAGNVGVVLSNASASLDADINYFATVKEFASPALFVYTLPNIVIGEICIKHKLKGENAFFIFEHFDGYFIARYVGDLLSNNVLQACICGWVEWLGDQYAAVLFLVEKSDGQLPGEEVEMAGNPAILSGEKLNQLYQLYNG